MPGGRKVGRERERNEERGRTGVDRKEARSEKRPAQKDKAAAEIGEGLQTCRLAKSNNVGGLSTASQLLSFRNL